MINMIAAIGKNNELGKNNRLIWHIPKDMKFFKETTMGHSVVMGRKTYESLPSGNLPGRKMIVLSTNKLSENIEVVNNIHDILERYLNSDKEIFIIGGSSMYKEFIKYSRLLYLTEIDAECNEANVFFPQFNKLEWDKRVIEENSYNNIKYQICKYRKKIM